MPPRGSIVATLIFRLLEFREGPARGEKKYMLRETLIVTKIDWRAAHLPACVRACVVYKLPECRLSCALSVRERDVSYASGTTSWAARRL